MSIDVEHFTPLRALLGGALIGLSAGTFLLTHGRIAGISGLLGQVLGPAGSTATGPASAEKPASWAFLAGLVATPLVLRAAGWPLVSHVDSGLLPLGAAGLLVGFGTRYGGGCTSGHGVCGLSNLSLRSAVATALFMASAIATVTLQRVLA